MKKLEALRALLITVVPGLKTKPENLSIYVDKGGIGTVRGETLSFEYRYTVKIMIQDYAGDTDAIFVPLVAWVAENQTELTRRDKADAFSFEVDLLDSDTSDIEISIDLTEDRQVCRDDASGSWQVTYLPDVPMIDVFDGVPAVRLTGILINDLVEGITLELPEQPA